MGRDDRVRAGLGEQTRAGQMLGDAASSGSSSTSAGRAERAGAARPAPVRLSRPSQPTVVRRIGTGVAEPRKRDHAPLSLQANGQVTGRGRGCRRPRACCGATPLLLGCGAGARGILPSGTDLRDEYKAAPAPASASRRAARRAPAEPPHPARRRRSLLPAELLS